MKRNITDSFLTIVTRRMKWLETKSLAWIVKSNKDVAMKTMAVLIVITLRRILRKLKEENAYGLRMLERNKEKLTPDYTFKNFFGFLEARRENDSLNFPQAMQSDESFAYKKWIIQFLDDLELLNAYKAVEKPKRVKTLGSRWVSKKKSDAEGNLLKFKSRLTTLEIQLKSGIDDQETFAAVDMNGTSRWVFVVAGKWRRSAKALDFLEEVGSHGLTRGCVWKASSDCLVAAEAFDVQTNNQSPTPRPVLKTRTNSNEGCRRTP